MNGRPWQFDLDGWVTAATTRHAEIESLHLVGSRAAGSTSGQSRTGTSSSLSQPPATPPGGPIADIERRIVCDPGLDSGPVDIWFLRPDGRVARPQPNGETWLDSQSPGSPAGWGEGSDNARCLYGPSLVVDTETRVFPANPDAGIDEMTLVMARWLARN